MKTATVMKRTSRIYIPFFVGLAIMVSTGSTASAQGDLSAVPELAAAQNRVQQATMAMKQTAAQGNPQAMERARERHRNANQEMAECLARVAGIRTEDVIGMQRAGMGWGQIAQELGMEPAHLGLGKQGSRVSTPGRLNERDRTRDINRELSEATSRNMKNAGATKHGMAMVGAGSKGMGLGKAKGVMSAGNSKGSGGNGRGGSGGGGGGSGGGGGGSGGGGSGGGR